MRFYYGADSLVIKPLFNYGNPSNDYGLGFYLTADKELARLWASKFEQGGFLIEYDVDVTNLNILHLDSIKDEDVLAWISILVSHRFSKEERAENISNIQWLEENYPIALDGVDVIIGYRADDSYFDYSRDFVRNELSLEILKDAMRLGKLGNQFVLKSKKAFNSIKYIRSEKVEHAAEYEAFRKRTKMEYFKLKKEDDVNNTYIRDLIRRKSGNKQ